ncbi:uncharacterized protein [Glycine max]|uniref:uncharacterized protein isoform X1 n=1 Tax=Glycine max TaxID=3847 RepID=UPI001B35576F|nr:uncharacterized protein LOC100803862 isoform X1 [Glycine max]
MLEPPRPILNKPEPSAKTVTSSSRVVPARLLKFLLPRLVSTVMPSVTLLGLIFSLPRSLKILCPLLTTVMYALVHVFHVYCFFSSVNSLSDDTYWNFSCSQILFVFFFLFQVPHVNRTDYQLIDIAEDGFLSLLTENGNTKDDLKLPTDESLLTQIKDGFAEGKDLVVSVMSAMGEEQICALKDIGPKN